MQIHELEVPLDFGSENERKTSSGLSSDEVLLCLIQDLGVTLNNLVNPPYQFYLKIDPSAHPPRVEEVKNMRNIKDEILSYRQKFIEGIENISDLKHILEFAQSINWLEIQHISFLIDLILITLPGNMHDHNYPN